MTAKPTQPTDWGQVKDLITKHADRHAREMTNLKKKHMNEIKKVLRDTNKDPIQMQECFRIYQSTLIVTNQQLNQEDMQPPEVDL